MPHSLWYRYSEVQHAQLEVQCYKKTGVPCTVGTIEKLKDTDFVTSTCLMKCDEIKAGTQAMISTTCQREVCMCTCMCVSPKSLATLRHCVLMHCSLCVYSCIAPKLSHGCITCGEEICVEWQP